MTESVRHFAALDIGSNSLNLALVRIGEDGRWEQVGRHKETVRLAEGLEAAGNLLTEDAMERALDALGRCLEYARGYDAPVRAVATSAMREARNRQELLDRIQEKLGLHVDVVSGFEEARLIWLGLQTDPALAGKRVLSVDIGGGSAEFCLGHDDHLDFASSLPLGGVRLAGRFFPDGDVTPKTLKACREWVDGRIEPIVRAMRGSRWDVALASAGTVGNLVRMAVERREGKAPLRLHRLQVSRDELLAVCQEVCQVKTTKQRRKLPGIDEKRADILPAGAVVIEQVIRRLGIDSLAWSNHGLREGVVRDWMERELHAQGTPELVSWRRRGVEDLAEAFSLDRRHDVQVERLARDLFLQLQPEHGLDENSGELLEAAAHLHEVGLRVGFEEHHKHSYYVIRHSHLLSGFVDLEIERIAQIARYHRKSHPKASHTEWMLLPLEMRRQVEILAGILRVADGLDRRHRGNVAGVRVRRRSGHLVIEVMAAPNEDTSMEVWGADTKKSLLETVLGKNITLVQEEP